METYNAYIQRDKDQAILKLCLESNDLSIVLTEDNPNAVKEVFNKLLDHLKRQKFRFELQDEQQDLYHHICHEYIIQLNAEIDSIYQELLDYGLLQVTE